MPTPPPPSPVPHLDLAPRLRRPLSLWHPRDYLRLLYWAFCFPRAIRWYLSVFAADETDFKDAKTWQEKWHWWAKNPIQSRLLLQGLILQIFAPFCICYLPAIIGVSISWSGMIFGISEGIASSVLIGIAFDVASVIAFGVSVSIIFGIIFAIAGNMGSMAIHFACVVIITASIINLALKINTSRCNYKDFIATFRVAYNSIITIFANVIFGTVFSVALTRNFSACLELVVSILVVISTTLVGLFWADLGTTFGIVVLNVGKESQFGELHLEIRQSNQGVIESGYETIFESLEALSKIQRNYSAIQQRPNQQRWLSIGRLFFSFPFLTRQLGFCLQWDEQDGLQIIDQLLKQTFQSIPAINAINLFLSKIQPEDLLKHIAILAESPCVRYASASLANQLNSEFIHSLSMLPRPFKNRLLRGVNTNLRLDTPLRAAAAGFWYLHVREPAQAVAAFSVVQSLPHGAEMLLLAEILDRCQTAELPEIAILNLPLPPSEPLLRPTSWQTIAALRRASEDIRVVCNAASRSARAFASNRALGELNAILKNPQTLPEAERRLILDIAEAWRENLLKSVGEIGRIKSLKPVQNPYVTGDPVEGSLFVGRDDIMQQLEELWFINHQLQSVVLYGHRRMGKTSVLRNVNARLGSTTQLIYVNLLNLGEVTQGAGEVLLAICDEIARATHQPAPADHDLLTLPYPTFKRYLQALSQAPNAKGLIIALDEFERLEDLIQIGQLSPDFLAYLRGLVQMSPQIAFAFAGLHTLEEMTEDYFSPFFASIIPIRLSFLAPAATRQLLANPSDDFPLDYDPKVYDAIFHLTAGQPYLVQLLGFQLVRRYNTQVFEQGRDRSHQFTLADLDAITTDPDLFTQGRYYFTGVWQEAAKIPAGQQAVLRAIAPAGLSLATLRHQTQLAEVTLAAAIVTLQRHDVIHEVNQQWAIKVELFRRWLMQLPT